MTPATDRFTDDRPHLVGGAWTAGDGEAFYSTSPATGERVWEAAAAAAAEVTAAAPTLAGLFRRSSRLFEDAFFGELPVAQADFLAVWEDRDRIASFARTAGD